MNEQLLQFPVIPEYTFHGPFAYSLRCVLCRRECPHTIEQHDILRFGIEVTK